MKYNKEKIIEWYESNSYRMRVLDYYGEKEGKKILKQTNEEVKEFRKLQEKQNKLKPACDLLMFACRSKK